MGKLNELDSFFSIYHLKPVLRKYNLQEIECRNLRMESYL